MRSFSFRVTAKQWLLAGGLLLIYFVFRLTPNRGTAWQSVSGLSFSPDGAKIAVGIYGGYFRHAHERWYFADLEYTSAIVDPTGERPMEILSRRQLVQKAGVVNMLPEILIGPSVAFSQNGRLLATVGYEGAFDVWDVDSGRQIRWQSMGKPHIRTFVSLPHQNTFITAFRRWATIWNFDDAVPPQSLETSVNIQALVPSPDGRQFAMAGFKPLEIQFWDSRKNQCVKTYHSPVEAREGISSMAYSPDGKTLIAANDMNIEIVDVQSLAQIGGIPERLVLGLAVSPDGKQLATARFDGVTVWDLPKRQKISWHWNFQAAETVQFSPDGKLLAAGSTDGAVHVWNANTGELLRTWNFPAPPNSSAPQVIKYGLVVAWIALLLLSVRQFIGRHWFRLRNFRF